MNGFNVDKFKSTKWQLALIIIFLSSFLTYYEKINAEWSTTVLVVYISYVIGNVTSATLGNFSIQGKQKEKANEIR